MLHAENVAVPYLGLTKYQGTATCQQGLHGRFQVIMPLLLQERVARILRQ